MAVDATEPVITDHEPLATASHLSADRTPGQPEALEKQLVAGVQGGGREVLVHAPGSGRRLHDPAIRSEEHTSELQSRGHLVCRLLLEKKKKQGRRWKGKKMPPDTTRERSQASAQR